MTTRLQYRNQIRRLVKDQPGLDTLAAGISASAVTASLTLGDAAGAPQVWEIGSEAIWVSSWTSPTGSGLQRGFWGTTAATASAGDQVRISPRFLQVDLNAALASAIRRMTSLGLYRIKTVDVIYNSSIMGYDIASDMVDVYEVRAQQPGSANEWPLIRDYQVLHDMPTTSFTSGKGIVLYSAGQSGFPIRVRYKARYGTFTSDTQDSLTDLGIQDMADDLPVVGAAAELLQTEEIHRTQIDAAEESERAQDVPSGSARTLGAQLDARFRERVSEVLADLNRTYMPTVRYTG